MNNIDKSKIDVMFKDGTELIIGKEDLLNDYITEYYKLKNEYAAFYKAGEGFKTNKYHEPVMNKAYNYIEHDDFKKIAKEPVKGYDKYNRPTSTPIEYPYYLAVWSIACMRVEEKHFNKFKLKFDHRYKDKKNEDFDGTLFCYRYQTSWSKRNLPGNQRY